MTFMNQHGVEEAGIDGGGVFKEYMDLLTKRAFDPQYALFLATEDQVGFLRVRKCSALLFMPFFWYVVLDFCAAAVVAFESRDAGAADGDGFSVDAVGVVGEVW